MQAASIESDRQKNYRQTLLPQVILRVAIFSNGFKNMTATHTEKTATPARILSVRSKPLKIIRQRVAVSFMVPKAIAEALETHEGYSSVKSAWVAECWEAERIEQWANDTVNDGKRCRSRKSYLAAALKMPLDTKITTLMPAAYWQGVGGVCAALGITPAEWMLAGAAYNAAQLKRCNKAA